MMVADTDVLIDALAGVEPARSRIDFELSSGHLATTVINAFELLSGARMPRQRERVEKLLEAMEILPLEPSAGETAAEIRRRLESRGEGIGMADYLIAGICRVRNAMVVTRNRGHFRRVPELSLGRLEPSDLSEETSGQSQAE